MPSYDYFCETNGQVVEATHSMQERLTTWGELCGKAKIEPGNTPADAPITKLITGGGVVHASSLKDSVPPCQSGAPCCGARQCGLG